MSRSFFRRWFRPLPTHGGKSPLSRTKQFLIDRLEDRTVPAVLDLTASVGTHGSFGPTGYTGAGVHDGFINGAFFQQSLTNTATGSGTFPSFVQIQHKDIEQGYNYDAAHRTPQFDEKNDPPHNHLVLLGDVPVVTVGGVDYRSFRLDLHESEGGTNELLSLDELRLFLTDSPPIQDAYSTTTNELATADGSFAPLYDMDNPTGPMSDPDNWILLDSTLSAGSGKGDMLALIPDSLFLGADDDYVTLYSKFGVHGNSIPGADTSATFEEWSYIDLGGNTPTFTNFTVTGHKFEDADGNLGTTGDQTPKAGWTILVNGSDVGVTTDANGVWSYTVTAAGSFVFTEATQSGWTQLGTTTSYTVVADANGYVSGPLNDNDFFNFHNATLCGVKYYDADVSGTRNGAEPTISGWTIQLVVNSGPFAGTYTTTTDATGSYCFGDLDNADGDNNPLTGSDLGPGTYSVNEVGQTGWVQTGGIGGYTIVATSGLQSTNNDFGNVKLGQCGGLTLGFWSNKNGQAILAANDSGTASWRVKINALNLRNASGGNFDISTTASFKDAYAAFRTWILGATATNMAYMLSAQMAATTLDVCYAGLDGNALIYVPGLTGWSSNPQGASLLTNLYSNGTWTTTGNFVKLSEVLANANTLLGANGLILAGNSLRLYAEALKIVCDGVNNSNVNNSNSPGPICVVGLGAWHDDNHNGVIDAGEI